MGVRSVIPPDIGRPSAKPPAGRFRRLMGQRFARKADRRTYGQRAQSETVNSMIKRTFGDDHAVHPAKAPRAGDAVAGADTQRDALC
jgi:hypothetical protein